MFLFLFTALFKSDISKWDMSGVTTMNSIFHHTLSFNSDISKWYVSGATTMSPMFISAWWVAMTHRKRSHRLRDKEVSAQVRLRREREVNTRAIWRGRQHVSKMAKTSVRRQDDHEVDTRARWPRRGRYVSKWRHVEVGRIQRHRYERHVRRGGIV